MRPSNLLKKLLCFLPPLACMAIAVLPGCAQSAPPIPRIENHDGQFTLLVDGQPFLLLGGQAHNSSATNPDDLKAPMDAMVDVHANTIEVPIYWELMEPEPGKFDFHLLDAILDAARQRHLRVVLLWFGSWKNGEMTYTPAWVKHDTQKYQRVHDALGQELYILSPLCVAAQEADARAFAAVMRHLRQADEAQRTVIMIQVENETGFLGTDRDYSAAGTQALNSPVPPELVSYLAAHRKQLAPDLAAAWEAEGNRSAGNWTEVFGRLAPEACSAWYVARYVDAVAAAGKQAYSLPMYVNNWLINPGNERAGRWPSGGPTAHVLDIWKAAGRHLDLLAPDIYQPHFRAICEQYSRPDNPLFVPEVMPSAHYAPYVFLTLADFNGLGFSPFGIDGWAKDGKVTAEAADFEDSYRLLQPMLPVIARLRYSGKLHALVQEEDWAQLVPLGDGRHWAASISFPGKYSLEGSLGRGIILEMGPGDYVFSGENFEAEIREMQGVLREARFLSLEEGTFDDGRWVTTRRLNGDEFHLTFGEKGRTLRVRMMD
jgi:beta-galactosidase GanA